MTPQQESPPLRLRARGPLACFTRPELKVERVSYPVLTPSAARGVLEAVLWKPAIAWRVERIEVLSEIRFTSFRRNEVNTRAAPPSSATVREGGPAPMYFSDEDRAQRNTVALRDVDYLIQGRFRLTDRAGEGETTYCRRTTRLDVEFSPSGNRPLFFEARLPNGILDVPLTGVNGGAK